MSHSHFNKVYYNVSITPEGRGGTPAEYFETRTTPIFDGPPSDYNLSVVRFSIPTGYVPIQIIPIDITQPDINQTTYSITLEWSGNIYQEFVIWETQFPTSLAPTVITQYGDERYLKYYSLYSIDYLFNLVNEAYIRAFDKLVLDGAPIIAPPFIDLDNTNYLVSIYVPESYVTNDVKVYHNEFFNRNFVNSFSAKYPNLSLGREVEIQTKNVALNADILQYPPYPQRIYLEMRQLFSTTQSMSSFDSLVITSRSIPITTEWITSQSKRFEGDPQANQAIKGSGFLNILQDFKIDQSKGWELGNVIIYNPTAEYRRITLKGNSPIEHIDVQVFWKDNFDNLHILEIPEHKILSIKMLFEKIN
jgi:hypothetical protein